MAVLIDLDGSDEFEIVAPQHELMLLQMQATDDLDVPVTVTGQWDFFIATDAEFTDVVKRLSTGGGEITISTSYLTINLSTALTMAVGKYYAYLRKTEGGLTSPQGNGLFIITKAPAP